MMTTIKYSRTFAMPSRSTFSIPPILDFVERYLRDSTSSIDPFAGTSSLATHTNDIDENMPAQWHLDAEQFVQRAIDDGIRCDLALFDPPYSPRQMAEHYRADGIANTQNGRLYRKVRNGLDQLLIHGAIVLSFGWNSAGMGKGRRYSLLEVLLVAHGGAHNDTICVAERKA